MIPSILEKNVYDKVFKPKFLIAGTCIKDLYPDVFEKFKASWKNVCSFCFEESHYNQLFAKLTNIIAIGNTKRIGFLTVDQSPHCVQMHYMSKYLKRALKKKGLFEHYVIAKGGKVYKVSMRDIDNSKEFARIGKLQK